MVVTKEGLFLVHFHFQNSLRIAMVYITMEAVALVTDLATICLQP